MDAAVAEYVDAKGKHSKRENSVSRKAIAVLANYTKLIYQVSGLCMCGENPHPQLCIYRRLVEQADTTDLKSVVFGRAGSSPASAIHSIMYLQVQFKQNGSTAGTS